MHASMAAGSGWRYKIEQLFVLATTQDTVHTAQWLNNRNVPSVDNILSTNEANGPGRSGGGEDVPSEEKEKEPSPPSEKKQEVVYFPASKLLEYEWPRGAEGAEHYMLQEQVAEFLDIRGIQRKYPGTCTGYCVSLCVCVNAIFFIQI